MPKVIMVLFLCGFTGVAQALDIERLQSLVDTTRELASKTIIMPVEEIRLAAQFAELAGSERESQNTVISTIRNKHSRRNHKSSN